MNYLIFDIGGTYTRFVFYKSSKKKIIERVETVKNKKLYGFLEKTTKNILSKYNLKKFDGIVISAPGSLSCKEFKLIKPPNLPKVRNLQLSGLKKFTKKLILENDANCAALGAFKKYGSAKNSNLVCLTLGTGIGCGIITNKKLYKGEGKASEFGHTTIDFNGRKCTCGNIGCLEEYVSTRGLLRIAKNNGLKVDCYELYDLANKGNKKALKTYREYGNIIAVALVNIANTLDPSVIVLTGGLSYASEFFLSHAKKKAKLGYFEGINPVIKCHSENLSLMGALELIKNEK
ncbi:ROK family protein [Candidatus Pacearchaeota archaeon]|nr:ROK family protein [Candidatus Pacearchaeota archaeon]